MSPSSIANASKIRVAVLVSGRGSNLRAICTQIDEGRCAAEVVLVLSDRRKAAALDYAANRSIPVGVVPLKKGDDRELWNVRLTEQVAAAGPDLVVLAGFMRVLGPPMLERFPGRIINVHPAILPSFPGHTAPEEAIEAGVRLSGCTVHVVDAGVDTGPIIAQAAVPVSTDDTPESLHARIQVMEHLLLPRVIHQIALGAIELSPLHVKLSDQDASRSLWSPDL